MESSKKNRITILFREQNIITHILIKAVQTYPLIILFYLKFHPTTKERFSFIRGFT
uniref:Uncharacterized protein n=1 Tax=Octopus bimaculoides TaxID=37653 RepID=A0A0L8G4W3_OCTBM